MAKIKIKFSAFDASLYGGTNPARLILDELSSSNWYELLKQKVDELVKGTSDDQDFQKKVIALIEKETTVYETAAMNMQAGDVISAQVITNGINSSTYLANQIVSVLRSMKWSFVLDYKKWEDYDEVVLYFQVCREEDEYDLVLQVKKTMGR